VQLVDATGHLADGTPFVAVTLPDDTLTRPTEVGLTLNSQPAEGASTSSSLPGQPMQDLDLTTAAMGSNTLIGWYKPVNTHRPAEMPVPPLRRSKRSRPARSAETVALVNALIDWDEATRLASPEASRSAAPQSGERKPNEAWS